MWSSQDLYLSDLYTAISLVSSIQSDLVKLSQKELEYEQPYLNHIPTFMLIRIQILLIFHLPFEYILSFYTWIQIFILNDLQSFKLMPVQLDISHVFNGLHLYLSINPIFNELFDKYKHVFITIGTYKNYKNFHFYCKSHLKSFKTCHTILSRLFLHVQLHFCYLYFYNKTYLI